MKRFALILLIVFVSAAGWNVGSQLSRDTVSIVLGIVLGVLAGLPVALIVLAAGRRSDRGRESQYYAPKQPAQQPPVVMLMGQGQAGQYPGQQQQYLPGPRQQAAGQWHSAPAASYDLWEGEQVNED